MKNNFHSLTTSGKCSIPSEFIFFDTETEEHIISKNEKHLDIKLGWAIYWNRDENIKEYFYFESGSEFWDFVLSKCKQDNEIILFAHNVDFDFKVCDGFNELFIKRAYELKNVYIEGKVFIMKAYKYGKTILLYDTANYIPKSLAFIGKSLGIKKMDIDFKTCSKEELSIYCKNDTEICFKLLETLLNFIQDNDLCSFKPTAAALSFDCFRHKFYNYTKNPIFVHIFKNVIKLERNSYKGGITDILKYGKFDKDLIKLDINSMYSFIMKNKEIAYKYLHSFSGTPNIINEMLEHLKTYDVVAELKIYIPKEYAYILTRYKKNNNIKCGFLHGTFTTTLCTPEIEYVLKYGKILSVNEYAIYERDYIFTDFVDYFYTKRLEYDEAGNTAFSLLCKLFLNSLYGKFAQRNSNFEVLNTPDIKPDIFKMPKEAGSNVSVIQIGNKLVTYKKTNENSFNSLVIISSLVTAYARMYIIDILLKIGRENVYYIDTDCLICNKEAINKISEYIDSDKTKKLGLLKIEGESSSNIFYRPKFYKFGEDFKCKGVKKKHKVLIDNKKTFKVEQENFERFKTSIRKRSIDYVRVTKIKKQMDKIYDKGIILNNCDIEPFNADKVKIVDYSDL